MIRNFLGLLTALSTDYVTRPFSRPHKEKRPQAKNGLATCETKSIDDKTVNFNIAWPYVATCIW